MLNESDSMGSNSMGSYESIPKSDSNSDSNVSSKTIKMPNSSEQAMQDAREAAESYERANMSMADKEAVEHEEGYQAEIDRLEKLIKKYQALVKKHKAELKKLKMGTLSGGNKSKKNQKKNRKNKSRKN
jgi:hypothetical protein